MTAQATNLKNMLKRAGDYIRRLHNGSVNSRILDLGAGTGLFAAFVRQKYPQAEFTLIDLSEEMMKVARLRFEGSEQVEYISADYTNYNFEHKYDIVISSLSIHHLTHEAKQGLFHKVRLVEKQRLCSCGLRLQKS
ncbi:class I SAM-dependent methyltransferase [Paenibacillus sp. FSL H8-0537]|uniref:class I SAM-dependent methyltransferase n=1 Tax=Paenibacillus sp. FSL H8-0537 TaxID=2921399 RepID=UPI0031016F4E